MNANALIKTSTAFILWLVAATLLGFLIGRGFGAVAGFVIGLLYAGSGLMACDKLPINCYEGRLMMREEDFELVEMVDELSQKVHMSPPDIYILALDQPNVIAWATSSGKVGFSRIGISPDLRSVLNPAELQAAMAMAVVRIASGESALLSRGASIAGLALEAAYAPFTNKTLGFMKRDPDTGLTPIGATLMLILAPVCRMVLGVTDPGAAWTTTDATTMRLLGSGAPIASMLRKLSGATGACGTGALRGYNPALVGLFLASPLEKMVKKAETDSAERKVEAEEVAKLKAAANEVARKANAEFKAKAEAAKNGPAGPHGPIGGSKPPARVKAAPVRPPSTKGRLGWSARVAAWISDVVPPIELRTFTVDPNGIVEPTPRP